MQWILQTISQIDSIKSLQTIISDYKIWNEYVQVVSKSHGIVEELENALINMDYILIGDMLQYEIIHVFENMNDKLNFLKSRR